MALLPGFDLVTINANIRSLIKNGHEAKAARRIAYKAARDYFHRHGTGPKPLHLRTA